MTRRFRLGGAPLIILACLFWSFSGVLGKTVAFHPLTLTGFRAVIASVMLGAARKSYRLGFGKGTMLGAWGVALTSLLYLTALSLTTAANAITLQYSMPVYVALFDFLLFRKKPSLKQLCILPLLILGVALCCAGDSEGAELKYAHIGNLVALLSGVSFSVGNIHRLPFGLARITIY